MRLADNSPPSFHNGGDIHFGPDGYLYMSSGDGGQESGTHWFAECLWKKPNDTTSTAAERAREPQYFLRGKMLRIDVDNRGAIATPEMCGTADRRAGRIFDSADNPYVGTSQTCDEIYLYGFRNPWRWSFDRATGDMWIGDVGQDHFEEIDRRERIRRAALLRLALHGRHRGFQLDTGVHAADRAERAAADGIRSQHRARVARSPAVTAIADRSHSMACTFSPIRARARSSSPSPTITTRGHSPSGATIRTATARIRVSVRTRPAISTSRTRRLDTVYRFHSDQTAVTHVVTPSADPHGTLTPSTPQTVNDGDTIAFTVQAEAGYTIADVPVAAGRWSGTHSRRRR